MKRASKLVSTLVGASMALVPTLHGFSQSDSYNVNYEPKTPLKSKTIVSSDIVPVKNLKKTIDCQTLKPVKELQEETVSYVDRNEGFSLGYIYVPSEDKFYDKNSSEKISKMDGVENREVTNFYGDICLNPYAQPDLKHVEGEEHIKTLDYYGSGNVAGANGTASDVLTWDDYNAIFGSNIYQADVDRDGISGTQADKNLLEDYLLDEIPYLPSHFELLQTEAEKENWSQTFTDIDSLHSQSWNICTDATIQGQVDASGIENIAGSGLNFSIIDTTKNALHNGPYYMVSTVTQDGTAHSVNAVLVGISPADFNDWQFREPQNGAIVTPGSPSMNPNSYADIEKLVYFGDGQGNYYYDFVPLINFDLNNGNPTIVLQHPDLVTSKPDKFNYIHIGGQKPADATVNIEDGIDPSVTGEATGYADWATPYYSDDSTTQSGSVWDSTYYNYDLFRGWRAVSDSNNIIDTTYASINPIYNRPDQVIHVQDISDPEFTSVYGNQSIPYSQWLGGIPLSQGSDNCGLFQIVRNENSTQGSSPDSCNFYNFDVTVHDSIFDPSNNWRDTTFTVNVYLDPHQFLGFPGPSQVEYKDELTTDDTGGLPEGAFNPNGIDVFVNQNPNKINSTQDPDTLSKWHYWYDFDWNHNAYDTICGDNIYQDQHVTVIEINPPFWSYVTPDTTVIEGTNLHPDNLGWSVATDTVTPVTPEVNYWDELIEEVPDVYRVWERHWNAVDLSGTNAPDTSSYITEDLQTGVINNLGSLEKKLHFYPNPTSGKFNVRYETDQPSRVAAEIYDASGRLVDHDIDTYMPGESRLEFDISDKAAGIYFIELSIDGKTIFKDKILKRNN
jgi:hypothetical protein